MMKKICLILLCCLLLIGAFSGCGKTEIPSDFTFSLTWNVFGISSYDSASGRLIKSSDATDPSLYTTTLMLTTEQKEGVRNILSDLNLSKYPAEYNPTGGTSIPSMTLILVVRYGDTVHRIACEGISLSFESYNAKGQRFLDACQGMIDIITATDEWKALPDYDHYYE